MSGRAALCALAASGLALAFAGGAGAKPRAVSLDYCADQFLIALADRDQIIAVSPDAGGAESLLRDKAHGLKRLRPFAEDIIPQRPDVVLRVWGGSPRLGALLERHGAEIVTLPYADDFDDVRAAIRAVAAALEQEARGEALIAATDEKLAALAQNPLHEEAGVYVTPGGVTAGAGTMIDAIFNAARLRNATAEAGLSYWPPLPAEQLALAPPSIIVTGFFRGWDEAVNHWSAARHPVFRRIFADARVVHLPADLVSCPSWASAGAAALIADALQGETAP